MGSDLHLYDGYIPTMKKGDILAHEFMGEVVETGHAVRNLNKGDRVVGIIVCSSYPSTDSFMIRQRVSAGDRSSVHSPCCFDPFK